MITSSRIDSFVTSVRGTTIGKRNAKPRSRRTNPAWIGRDKNTGHKDMSMMTNQ
jgi:hypothetical protein